MIIFLISKIVKSSFFFVLFFFRPSPHQQGLSSPPTGTPSQREEFCIRLCSPVLPSGQPLEVSCPAICATRPEGGLHLFTFLVKTEALSIEVKVKLLS